MPGELYSFWSIFMPQFLKRELSVFSRYDCIYSCCHLGENLV